MNIHIFILAAILLPSIAKAENFSGLDCSDQYVYFSKSKTVYALSHDNKNFQKKNLSEDSVFILTLNTIAKNYGCDSKLEANSKNLANFNIINLTHHKNQLFICVGFNLMNQLENTNYKYGLIALNQQLNVINYYTFSMDTSIDFLTILPYFPLEFKDSNTFMAQYYKNGKKVGDFKLNKKSHRITKGSINQSIFLPTDSIEYNFSTMQNNFVSPVLYLPMNCKQNYFYIFPYPVLFNSKNFNSYFDLYKQKQKIIDTYSPLNSDLSAPDYLNALSIDVERIQKGSVILTSQQTGDTLYTLVSSPLTNTTDLIIFNTVTQKSTLLSIASKCSSSYCIIRNRKIYQLCLIEKKPLLNVIELNFTD